MNDYSAVELNSTLIDLSKLVKLGNFIYRIKNINKQLIKFLYNLILDLKIRTDLAVERDSLLDKKLSLVEIVRTSTS